MARADDMEPTVVGADWVPGVATEVHIVTPLVDAINHSNVVIFIWRIAEGWPVEFVSENVSRWGYTTEEIYSGKVTWVEMVHPDDATWLEKAVEHLFEIKAPVFTHTYRILTKAGDERWIIDCTSAAFDADGNITHYQGVIQDITEYVAIEQEKSELEEQLRQTQRQELIGRMAGGVAHDFNNLLTPIMGFSEYLLSRKIDDPEVMMACEHIYKAANHAAQLVRHLVAFGSKQVLDMQVIDTNNLITGFADVMKFLLGKDIRLQLQLDSQVGNIVADATQVEQVLMNLAVNARDAMLHGGTFTVATHVGENKTLQIDVSDTGSGIDSETLPYIFEPFFTTKGDNEGTGLGLATVYGILQQHRGQITATSAVGVGTTFHIELPRTERQVDPPQTAILTPASNGIGETILVAEDAKSVRVLVGDILRNHGYTVILADCGEAAIRMAVEHEGSINLFLTDMVMKKMNGRQAAQKLHEHNPGLPVVYMSGYSTDILTPEGALEVGTRFLLKPFTMDALLKVVREGIAEVGS